jgi:hypothetical protein
MIYYLSKVDDRGIEWEEVRSNKHMSSYLYYLVSDFEAGIAKLS